MSLIKIDKDIAIPQHALSKYPWADLEVGDSFAVPANTSFRTQASAAAKKLKRRFTVKQIGDEMRVWRVS